MTHVGPGQSLRVTAGGFAADATVLLSFTTADAEWIELEEATAGSDGRIDMSVKIPKRIPRGPSQVSAMGNDAADAEFGRAWLVTVNGGPKP